MSGRITTDEGLATPVDTDRDGQDLDDWIDEHFGSVFTTPLKFPPDPALETCWTSGGQEVCERTEGGPPNETGPKWKARHIVAAIERMVADPPE